MSGERRIVSLVPSLTQMVCDFGLEDQVVGVTTFCVEPKGLAKKVTIVGGTKDPDLDEVRELRPTHILVNEEENKPEHIAECRVIASTFVTFPKDPADVPAMLRAAGAWLDVEAKAEEFAKDTDLALQEAAARTKARRRRALYLIWREPYMVASHDTYISGMMQRMGIENVAPATSRYPTMTIEEMRAARPDLLLLSSEPYPFRNRDMDRLREEWPDVPEMRKIDGQLMSWYGTMTARALREL